MDFSRIPCGGFYIDANTLEFVEIDNHPVLTVIGGGGGSAGVASFNGRTGRVVPENGDYTAEMVGAIPVGSPVNDPIQINYTPTNDKDAISKGYLDTYVGNTLPDVVTEKVEHAVENKQDTITGTQGELVGFDSNGDAIPVDIIDGGEL